MAHQLTHVAALLGDPTRAALLCGAVDGLAHEVGARVFHVWQELSDRCQVTALAELRMDHYTQLRREGRLLSSADVVGLATGWTAPHSPAGDRDHVADARRPLFSSFGQPPGP